MGKTVRNAIIGAVIFAAYAYLVVIYPPASGLSTPLAGLFGTGTAGLVGAAAVAGAITFGGASLLAPKVADLTDIQARARVTVNPEAPMTWIFGETSMSTDLVWAGQHGDKTQFYSMIIAGAGHLIESYEAFYINDELITFSGEEADGAWNGVLWRQINFGSETQGAFPDIDAADDFFPNKWPVGADGLGMAHYRLRFETSSDQISAGIPTRITQVVKGGPVYDPRLDSTRGGTGAHRTDNQATWEYDNGGTDIGANWALIVLRYLLGWKIASQLVIGMGIDGDDIDIDQAVAAANACDALIDGIPRYRIGGILPVSNDHEAIIEQLETAINGKVALVGGKYYIWAPNNDLAVFSSIDEADIIREGGVEFRPAGPMEDLYNTARGRFVDNSADGIFQLRPYPEVIESTAVTEDGGTRLAELDFPMIQDVSIAERIAREYVRRSRFAGTWRVVLGPKGFTFQPFSVTNLTCQETNNAAELVRIVNMTYSISGIVILDLLEEDSSIYDTTEPLGTPVTSTPVGDEDILQKLAVTGLAAQVIDVGGATGLSLDAFKVTWDDPGTFVRETHVQFKIAISATWTNENAIRPPAPEAFIYPLVPDTSYDIRARHISQAGVAGDFASIVAQSGLFTTLGGDSIFNSEKWVAPIADPMGGWTLQAGDIAESSMLSSIVGPFVHLPKTIRIQGDGTAPGWYSLWKHPFKINDSGSYIVYCWVRRRNSATDKGMHMGWLTTVQDLGSPFNDNSNAFSLTDVGSAMTVGTWYLGVSILHPSNYTGADVGIAGLYDPADGAQIVDGNEFRCKAGIASYRFRFGFRSTTTSFVSADGFEFTRPVGYRLDGTEPSIQTALDLAALSGASIIVANAYQRSVSTPAPDPPAVDDGQYDFATHVLTPPSGWSDTIPAVDGNPLWVTQGTFEVLGVSGVDTTVVWTSASQLVSDGVDSTVFYIKPVNGTAIHNGAGTLQIEAHKITGGVDTLLSSGTIKLFDPSNDEVTVANGYAAGSDGFTGFLDPGDINNDIVITMKDGVGGTPLDTITLVDIADGGNSTHGFIEPSLTLAWTQDPDGGAWTPSTLVSDLDCSFVRAGVVVTRVARRVTLASGTGFLTISATAHKGGDLDAADPPITVVVTGAGTSAVTVQFDYDDGAGNVASVAETSSSARGGDDGSIGGDGRSVHVANAYLRKATAPTTPSADTLDQYNFSTQVLTPPSVAGGSDDNWATGVPAGANPLYVISAVAEIIGTTGTDTGLTWTTPVILASDGIDTITSALSNPAHVLSSDEDLTNYDLTGSGGTHVVNDGNTDVTTSATHSITGGATKNGLTIAVGASTGIYTLSGGSWTTKQEQFTLRAVYNSVTLDKIYSIAKGAGGATGGSSAVIVRGANVVHEPTTPTDAHAEYGLYADGLEKTGVGTAPLQSLGPWLNSGQLADYEVECVVNSGTTPSGSPTGVGTWSLLSTFREWHLDDTSVAGPAIVCNLTITVRNVITEVDIDSGTVNLTAHEQA